MRSCIRKKRQLYLLLCCVPIIIFWFTSTDEPSEQTERVIRTRTNIQIVNNLLGMHYAFKGRLPKSGIEYMMLEHTLRQNELWQDMPSQKNKFKDAWGRKILYVNDFGDDNYLLYSKGPNGVDEQGQGDDVVCSSLCDLKK